MACAASAISVEEVFSSTAAASDDALLAVAVAQVRPREASTVLQFLSKELPLLPHSLQHLKRMRKTHSDTHGQQLLEVVLCAASTWELVAERITSICPADLHNIAVVQVGISVCGRTVLADCEIRVGDLCFLVATQRYRSTSRKPEKSSRMRAAFGRATFAPGNAQPARKYA